jgi:hypothetical protein
LTPQEQRVLGGFSLAIIDFFYCDILNLESQDDCPYETEREGGITVLEKREKRTRKIEEKQTSVIGY